MKFKGHLILFLLLTSRVFACPYCAGQSGENYIESIIIPVAGLVITPFIIFGIITSIIYFHKDKKLKLPRDLKRS